MHTLPRAARRSAPHSTPPRGRGTQPSPPGVLNSSVPSGNCRILGGFKKQTLQTPSWVLSGLHPSFLPPTPSSFPFSFLQKRSYSTYVSKLAKGHLLGSEGRTRRVPTSGAECGSWQVPSLCPAPERQSPRALWVPGPPALLRQLLRAPTCSEPGLLSRHPGRTGRDREPLTTTVLIVGNLRK